MPPQRTSVYCGGERIYHLRNKYPGICYRCSGHVDVGCGHFERLNGRWRVQHADCAIQFRGTQDPERAAYRLKWLIARAQGTGRGAQRARKELREMGKI